MKKYALEIVLIIVGLIGIILSKTESTNIFSGSKTFAQMGYVLVAIGGILAVIKANK